MISGFSKLTREEKRQVILSRISDDDVSGLFDRIQIKDTSLEELVQSFSENVISLFPFPYSLVPNFVIDDKEYIVPFVTEESSVVAAAAKSAKFWSERGGFKTEFTGKTKTGQIHFTTDVPHEIIASKIKRWDKMFLEAVQGINRKMIERGGGIRYIKLIDKTDKLKNYYQLDVGFNTCDAMGANYINTCLEGIAGKFVCLFEVDKELSDYTLDIVMSILSNYSPDNAVRVWVECPVDKLIEEKQELRPVEFAQKFRKAVEISKVSIDRAVTHNKGIYNGIDSVAIATGNDWRAIEANGHAYASRNGMYQGLSSVSVTDNNFRFEATIPMQVGTIGGITSLHPLTKLSMEILQKPSANELMKIIASAGLASNFSAIKALVTTGIQKGHMKMHLSNILAGFNASADQIVKAQQYFKDKTVSIAAVEEFLKSKYC